MSLWKDGTPWAETAGQDPDNFLEDLNERRGLELGTDTDWQDMVLRTGMQADYLIGIRGGNDKIRYNIIYIYYLNIVRN
jgi:hypothetical protein